MISSSRLGHLALAVLGGFVAAGCAPLNGDITDFGVRFIGVNDSDKVTPGAELRYEITADRYRRSELKKALIIENAGTTRLDLSGVGSIAGSLSGGRPVSGPFLEKAGKSRIFMQITAKPPPEFPDAATTARSQSVYVEVNPRLESIELVSPAAGESIALGAAP